MLKPTSVVPGAPAPLAPRWLLRAAIFALDATITALSLWLAFLLRFEGHIEAPYAALLSTYLVLLLCARLTSTAFFQLHRWSFRFSGLTDGVRIGLAGLLGSGLFILVIYLLRILGPPRSVVVLELLLSTAAMGALRFTPRLARLYWTQLSRSRRGERLRTLIVGAGAAGEMLLRDLQRSEEHSYQVVGFLDDDRSKWGTIVGGKPVLGGVNALPRIVVRHRVGKILIAIPRLPAATVREILSLCADLKVRIKILPVSYVYFQERGAASLLQDLSPDDLLPRKPVEFGDSERAAIAGRRVLVTGAAGSIGSEICHQLLAAEVGELVAVDLNENNLYLLEQRLRREHPRARLVLQIADIRDRNRMRALVRQFRPQDVVHAAAHKHVPLMEAVPCEAIKNNVLGTRNLLQAAQSEAVERFVFISTDKAVAPTSIMGVTKRIGEMMVRDLAARSAVRCCAVRFGNVLGSDGSVVPLFRQQIAAGGPVTITDPDVQRYFMTIREAVGLVLKAAYSNFGELCVLEMGEPIRILDLARHLITMMGLVPEVDIPIVFTGLRPGEKLHEALLTEEEEATLRVDAKIHVVEGPSPPADLWMRLAELEVAAESEDPERVRELLPSLVSSYRCATGGVPWVGSEVEGSALSA